MFPLQKLRVFTVFVFKDPVIIELMVELIVKTKLYFFLIHAIYNFIKKCVYKLEVIIHLENRR